MEFGLVAVWLAVFLALALAAHPLAAWLFPDMDHGAFAFPLALAVLGVVAHLAGHLAFGWPAAIIGIGVLAGLSIGVAGRVEFERRAIGEAAVVFTLGFLFVVGIRSVDPAAAPLPLAVGEKFLDIGLVQSLLRAPALPPEDMWFAGEPVRYYYGGHMLTALLATLTGTDGAFAYNLSLAGFYGTLVTAAYGLAGSIARRYDAPRRMAGALGAFFVGIAGNLEPAGRVVLWALPDGLASWVGGVLGLRTDLLAWTPDDFWYFDASRIVPVDPGAEQLFQAATEFPLFAWLNGDLHAHMMSQPFTLLVAGLLLAYWRSPSDWRRRRLLLFGAVPPVAGFIALVNGWSFPTAGGLTFVTVWLAPGDPARLLPTGMFRDRLSSRDLWVFDEARRLGLALGAGVVVLVLGVVWTLPFWTGVILEGPGKSVALWDPWTPLWGLVLVHGAFLAAFAPYLGRRIGTGVGRPASVWVGGFALLAGATLLGMPALGLVVPLLFGGWWLARTTDAGFEAALVVAGAGLVLLVELITVEGERFNTIFKAYAHVWLFWSVGSAVILARLAEGWPATSMDIDRARWRTTGTALAVVLVVLTGMYAGLALPDHVDRGSPTADAEGPTLNATAYLEVEYPAEAPAIRWLDAREGQPTIVTGVPAGYRWEPESGKGASAPASLTGLPAVLGWFHEEQYRGTDPYDRRFSHVEAIYTGDNRGYQRDLLDYYGVGYVYVGPAERAQYDTITVDEVPGVSVAQEWEQVTIYAVNQSSR
jgi:YYY domain-containing protein